MSILSIRKHGPEGVMRPYTPLIDIGNELEPAEKAAEALDHIAFSLSAIDHNLEVLAQNVGAILNVLVQQSGKPSK